MSERQVEYAWDGENSEVLWHRPQMKDKDGNKHWEVAPDNEVAKISEDDESFYDDLRTLYFTKHPTVADNEDN